MNRPPLLLLIALLPLAAHAAGPTSAPSDEIELGISRDVLDQGYDNWNSLYLDAAHRFGERHSVYGRLRKTQRFDLQDREISGGYYHPLTGTWTALIEASTSPDHWVLPQNSLYGQLQKAFEGGWDIQAGLRRSQYDTGSTDLAVLTGERYWGDFRAAYTYYLGRTDGGSAPSHRAQLGYYYAVRSQLTLGFAKGHQIENLGAGLGVLITDVTGSSLSGLHWFNPGWGLSYEVSAEQQGNLYLRKGIRLGLRHAF
ncbi:MAG TPA: YaiO family outer membrane beta-barrel protein [Gallionella sp.]